MKSIFDQATREEVIQRIEGLSSDCKAHWGKMHVAQMVRHCAQCEEYYHGNIVVKRSILGRFIGKIALKGLLKDESSVLQRNASTSPIFRVEEKNVDLEREKSRWKSLIERYASYDKDAFTHWFFGPMTKNQLGQFIYKHCDHHLRQFGV